MKNFKFMMVSTLLMSGFALQAAICPFTLINRTDGIIHANIGEQMATVSEWFSPYGYKTIQPGGASCFYMGLRFNEYNKVYEYSQPGIVNPDYKKANRLYIRYAGTKRDKTLYPAHVFNIDPDAQEFWTISDEEGEKYGPYSIRDFLDDIDYTKAVVIGKKAVLSDPGWVQLILFGKERGTDEDAAVILSTKKFDKELKLKTGDKEVQELKNQYRVR